MLPTLESLLQQIYTEDSSETASYYEYVDAIPVYHSNDIPVLREGVSYTFNGDIKPTCERFSISFTTANDDVALMINPRLPQNYIVRNSKVKNIWGPEEASSAQPFSLHRGYKFSIQVLVADDCYRISVNGQHFAKYNHRLPYNTVSTIVVKGDVAHVQVNRREVEVYPDRLPRTVAKEVRLLLGSKYKLSNRHMPRSFRRIGLQTLTAFPDELNNPSKSNGLGVPYFGSIPARSLTGGRCVKVRGRVKLLPHSFTIRLQQGQNIWPHALVAFRFNPCFSKQSGAIGKAMVARNAWYNGKWAHEERSELDTDFRPGKTFSMTITCGADAFEVYVNHKLITQFKHRVDPTYVDMVYVEGDIKLWEVTLENTSDLLGNKQALSKSTSEAEDD